MNISTHNILGLSVAVTSLEKSTDFIIQEALASRKGYVCAANVHMCMESSDDPAFRNIVNEAELIVPDGKPLYWWMKSFGETQANQVRGPDLFLALCKEAEQRDIAIALYGGTTNTIKCLETFLHKTYPGLNIARAISPPFRALTEEEDRTLVDDLNSSGARITFVALGCPKQEKWMAAHKNVLDPVMVGVGAAFDFYAGTIPVAPEWMRNAGFEWLYRFVSEPRRLWKRYLWNNPRFILHYVKAVFSRPHAAPRSGS